MPPELNWRHFIYELDYSSADAQLQQNPDTINSEGNFRPHVGQISPELLETAQSLHREFPW